MAKREASDWHSALVAWAPAMRIPAPTITVVKPAQSKRNRVSPKNFDVSTPLKLFSGAQWVPVM